MTVAFEAADLLSGIGSILLALLLARAAWHKHRDSARFVAALRGYRLLPAAMVPVVAWGVPLMEAVIALAISLPATRIAGAWAAAALLSLFAVAVAVNLLRGRRHIDCGCEVRARRRGLSWQLVGRQCAWVMVALSAAVGMQPHGVAAHAISILAALGFAALWAGADVIGWLFKEI